MSKTFWSCFVALAVILFVHFAHVEAQKNVVCYYTNWPQYRPTGGKFTVQNVDPYACTHLIFAFSKLEGTSIEIYEKNDKTSYKELTDLKLVNPNLKVLLAIGGWNHGPAPFASMVALPQSRQDFIIKSIKLLRDYNFDGLDLDWEYPVESNRHNLTALLREMRAAYDNEAIMTNRQRLMIAMAVSASPVTARMAYDIPAIDPYLDMYNLMAYDYHGSWEKRTDLATPMTSSDANDQLSVKASVNWYKGQGASLHKFNLGMAFYGRTWTLQNLYNGNQLLKAQAISAGVKQPFTREAGMISYYEICDLQNKQGLRPIEDPVGQSMYGVVGNQFVTFDNQQTLKHKLNFIETAGLAGAMIWALDLDDFTGAFCGQGKSPLLTTVMNRMGRSSSIVPVKHVEGLPLPSCDDGSRYVRDPSSCNTYYICQNGKIYPEKQECLYGQVFNPLFKDCEPQSTSTFTCNLPASVG